MPLPQRVMRVQSKSRIIELQKSIPASYVDDNIGSPASSEFDENDLKLDQEQTDGALSSNITNTNKLNASYPRINPNLKQIVTALISLITLPFTSTNTRDSTLTNSAIKSGKNKNK